MEEVLESDKVYYDFAGFEAERRKLLTSTQTINVTDLGAGSRKINTSNRSISKMSRTALSNPTKCQIIFKIIDYLGLENRLELGTSLGIMSLYMFGPNKDSSQFITLEGRPETLQVAQQVHKNLGLQIDSRLGHFDETLNLALSDLQEVHCVYIDGNHTYEATMRYVSQCLSYSATNSLIILDDIYWSDGMYQAWTECKNMNSFNLSISMHGLGFLFKNDQFRQKQDFDLIQYPYKPWKFDLF